jgi:HEAT repeat protein
LAFVGGLSSKDDSERWNAVEELGASGDPQAATYVVAALKDPELFVRMAAARVLGDLASPIAIAPLIETLADPEPSVREAALVSLRTLSGRDLAFEPNADPKVRAKQIEAWRAWWAEQSGAASDPG